MRYCFIEKHKDQYPVEKMCASMRVSCNAYYCWLKTRANVNTALIHLKSRIQFHFQDNYEIYGSTRIQKMLSKEGLIYSVSYIGKLMSSMGLKSVLKRKFVITTNSDHDDPIANNVLNREFESLKIGEKGVSDITYIRVANQWNYLTTIIDLADRKVVGWSLSNDMTTENTVYKAWLKTRDTRNKTGSHFSF